MNLFSHNLQDFVINRRKLQSVQDGKSRVNNNNNKKRTTKNSNISVVHTLIVLIVYVYEDDDNISMKC